MSSQNAKEFVSSLKTKLKKVIKPHAQLNSNMVVPLSDIKNKINAISARSLFIIGHARSGTTILADALNSHDEIFLSTEANYFLKKDTSDFIQSYNHMHLEVFANPLSKSTYMPLFSEQENNYWHDFVCELAKHHRWVGDKLAFHHFHAFPRGLMDFVEFQSTYFYNAVYIHIIRDPISTVLSTQKLLPATDLLIHAKSWLLTIKNWVRMVMFFPNSYSVLHEQLSLSIYDQLLDRLHLNKHIKKNPFNADKVVKHRLAEVNDAKIVVILKKMDDIYLNLKKYIPENLNEFDRTLKMHKSELYSISQTCDVLLRDINI